MTKQLLSILFFIILYNCCYSQLEFTIEKLKNNEALKTEWLASLKQDYESQIKNIQHKNKAEIKLYYKNRYESVKKLIESKSIITDNEVNIYMQKLVKLIYDANPELKTVNRRVLFSLDDVPNAFATGEGTIVFNSGLFVNLKNEAEIIFVLCHELAHDFLNHNNLKIENLVEKLNSKEYKDEVKQISKLEYGKRVKVEELAQTEMFGFKRHNRDKETEADRTGFGFMKNTLFNVNAIKTTLNYFNTCETFYDTTDLKIKERFNFTNFTFNNDWIKKETSIFEDIDKKSETEIEKKLNDSLATHPDCKIRIAALEKDIATIKNSMLFTSAESEFKKIQNKLQISIYDYLGENIKLTTLIFEGLKMLNNSNKINYANYLILQSLNGFYKLQKDHKLGNALPVESDYYNEQQNLLIRLFTNLTLEELAALNYNFAINLPKNIADNSLIKNEINIATSNYNTK